MTRGTTQFGEELLAALNVSVVQIASGRNSQTTVPHHELIVLLVGHLLLTIVGGTLEQILVEGLLLGDGRTAQYLVDAVGNASVGAVSIVGMQDAQWRGTILLDIFDDFRILALRLSPCRCGVKPVAVGARHVGDVPNGIGTSTILQRSTRHGIGEALQRTVVATMLAGVVIASSIVG